MYNDAEPETEMTESSSFLFRPLLPTTLKTYISCVSVDFTFRTQVQKPYVRDLYEGTIACATSTTFYTKGPARFLTILQLVLKGFDVAYC